MTLFFKGREFSSRSVNRDAGLDHLRQLLLEAHREYQEYVTTGVMTPRVFAFQFLDGHHYADDGNADGRNLHRKALEVVGILLTERTYLVGQFFSRTSLEAPDVDEMIALVYTERRYGEALNPESRERASGRHNAVPSLNCRIKEEDMVLLAECANHASFFKEPVDAAVVSDLLHCRLSVPLVADNLMGFAYLLDRLSAVHLVGRNWQTALERCGAILSGRGQASETCELCVRIEPREAQRQFPWSGRDRCHADAYHQEKQVIFRLTIRVMVIFQVIPDSYYSYIAITLHFHCSFASESFQDKGRRLWK